jgi:hypothetical protein
MSALRWFFTRQPGRIFMPSEVFTIVVSLVACGVSLYSWGVSVGVWACLGCGR